MNADKLALSASQAGMRFIAQMKFYNDQNVERLSQFITDSYTEALLQAESAPDRVASLLMQMAQIGRLKVKQVLATSKHHVAVALSAEKVSDFFYIELEVEEDYPHKISRFLFAPLEVIEE